MHKSFEYNFEWDPNKARTNYKKHGVSFERAASIFQDPKALSIFDQEHSHMEDRWATVGLDNSTFFVVVYHTYRQEGERAARIRIISARKATKSEIKQYQEIE